MKLRLGFVSNSSSSSFLCSVCGALASGYDVSITDCGMVECEKGHTFCKAHMIEVDDVVKQEILDENNYSDWDYYIDGESYDISSRVCPICNMVEFTDADLLKYAQMIVSVDMKQQIRDSFKTYEEFKEYIDNDK